MDGDIYIYPPPPSSEELDTTEGESDRKTRNPDFESDEEEVQASKYIYIDSSESKDRIRYNNLKYKLVKKVIETNERFKNDVNSKNFAIVDIANVIQHDIKKSIHINLSDTLEIGKSYYLKINKDFKELFQFNNKNQINSFRIKNAKLFANENFKCLNLDPVEISEKKEEWVWELKPLKSGENKINLFLDFKIFDSYSVSHFLTKKVYVKDNIFFQLKAFFLKDYEWIITAFLIPFCLYLRNFLKKFPKKRTIVRGFLGSKK